MKTKKILVETTILSYLECQENGAIEVMPLHDEMRPGETLTQTGVAVSYRGRVHVNANGDISIKPYNEKPRGKRPVKLYCSEHCTIRLHNDGHVSEQWHFACCANATQLAAARQHEMDKVNAFYRQLTQRTPFVVAEC